MLKIREATGKENQTFEDAMNIRLTVFVVEQKVPEQLERDEFDETATHYVGYFEGIPVVTLRVTPAVNGWHIQRVATVAKYRHNGYARILMQHVIDQAQDRKVGQLELNAQLTAIPFYEKLGFVAYGDAFDDAGIQHRAMSLAL